VRQAGDVAVSTATRASKGVDCVPRPFAVSRRRQSDRALRAAQGVRAAIPIASVLSIASFALSGWEV